jgi:hypothetical protein
MITSKYTFIRTKRYLHINDFEQNLSLRNKVLFTEKYLIFLILIDFSRLEYSTFDNSSVCIGLHCRHI